LGSGTKTVRIESTPLALDIARAMLFVIMHCSGANRLDRSGWFRPYRQLAHLTYVVYQVVECATLWAVPLFL